MNKLADYVNTAEAAEMPAESWFSLCKGTTVGATITDSSKHSVEIVRQVCIYTVTKPGSDNVGNRTQSGLPERTSKCSWRHP